MILPLCFIPAVTITEAGAIQRAITVKLPGQARDLPSLRVMMDPRGTSTQSRSKSLQGPNIDLIRLDRAT
ncbi:hypothetical protein QQF64_018676 [Cirrhinus molitorella]|uniref:Uncharacterized protein n=1 Tax=Cirrhinus molitorella TaxID=172907 RepID=A0ABR3LDD1_9TELE